MTTTTPLTPEEIASRASRLRDMRTLLDAAPVRYSGTAADACDAAADLLDRLSAERDEARRERDALAARLEALADVNDRATSIGLRVHERNKALAGRVAELEAEIGRLTSSDGNDVDRRIAFLLRRSKESLHCADVFDKALKLAEGMLRDGVARERAMREALEKIASDTAWSWEMPVTSGDGSHYSAIAERMAEIAGAALAASAPDAPDAAEGVDWRALAERMAGVLSQGTAGVDARWFTKRNAMLAEYKRAAGLLDGGGNG